ncbi:hypothetical protein [Aliidongia dinghuensis]|uniref:hypothetical protein n=1 Tax=Aliidongia dinghuensis TaxID=1867774 RepID=UPI00166DFAC7|nr:hypothetical protein [Aliidongia dinghuensis]
MPPVFFCAQQNLPDPARLVPVDFAGRGQIDRLASPAERGIDGRKFLYKII